jgi:hypothetical protein
LLSENLALPLSLGMLLLLPNAASGVALGLATLCRASSAFLFLASACFINWRRAILIAGLAFVVVLPWTLRNYDTFGKIVPVTTEAGVTLHYSFWPVVERGKTIWGVIRDDYAGGNEADRSREESIDVLRGLKRDPLRPLELVPQKLFYLFIPVDWELFPTSRTINWGYLVLFVPALIGALRCKCYLLWTLPLATVLQAIIFYGSPRFRLMMEPSLVIWAAASTMGFAESERGEIPQKCL